MPKISFNVKFVYTNGFPRSSKVESLYLEGYKKYRIASEGWWTEKREDSFCKAHPDYTEHIEHPEKYEYSYNSSIADWYQELAHVINILLTDDTPYEFYVRSCDFRFMMRMKDYHNKTLSLKLSSK